MSTPTATPRTEAELTYGKTLVPADFARQLETELAAAKEAHASQQRVAIQAISELAAAKAECGEWKKLLSMSRDDRETDLETELAAERAIVSRIWVQLGSPTYADLKGRSIYDLIDEIKTDRAEAKQEAAHYMSIAQKATDELAAATKRIADCEFLLAHRYKIIERQEPRIKEAVARAERAEAECLEQARLLGMSGEREAALLSKLAAKKP